jgi:hypothetical protein
MRPGKLSALLLLIGAALLALAAFGAPAQAAGPAADGQAAKAAAARPASSFTPLQGFGSSWAGPAISQWSADVHNQGVVINFDPVGSAAGRQDYILNQADFAASDIAFLTTPDPFQGGTENSPYAYSYIPIVAGGTTFPYNIVVGGRRITNMRLSGATITKIFTGQITNWDNSTITHHRGHPVRRLGRQLSVHPLDVAAVQLAVAEFLRTIRRPEVQLRADGVLPEQRAAERQVAERLGPSRQLHRVRVEQRGDRLRRIRLRPQRPHPRGEAAQPEGLLLAAHGIQ